MMFGLMMFGLMMFGLMMFGLMTWLGGHVAVVGDAVAGA